MCLEKGQLAQQDLPAKDQLFSKLAMIVLFARSNSRNPNWLYGQRTAQEPGFYLTFATHLR